MDIDRITELEKLVVDLAEKNNKLERMLQKKDLGNIPFTTFLSEWLQRHKKKIRKVTYQNYYFHVHSYIIPFFEPLCNNLNEITAAMLEKYFDFLLEDRELSYLTVHHHYSTLRCAFNSAIKDDLIDINPCSKIDMTKGEKYKADTLSFAELVDLMHELRFSPMFLPVLLGGFFGLRRSEVAGLTWNDISFQNHTIRIQNTLVEGYDYEDGGLYEDFEKKTKTPKSNRILLVPKAIECVLINERDKQMRLSSNPKYCTDYLDRVCVHGNGKIIKPGYMTSKFRKIIKSFLETDNRHIRFHDLRHSCATFLHEDFGFDIKDIQTFLGHSDINVTSEYYVHVGEQKLIKIANTINSQLLETMNVS